MSSAKKSMILSAARSVFLRYGFKRVNMSDIAESAGVSRPALYVLFKNKEQIFIGVYEQWVDETIKELKVEIEKSSSLVERLAQAFELWTVRPFEITIQSPEIGELVDCSFGFAQSSLREGYSKFEAAITPILIAMAEEDEHEVRLPPNEAAHVLANAARGFKQAVTTPDELRVLIKKLLQLSFGVTNQ